MKSEVRYELWRHFAFRTSCSYNGLEVVNMKMLTTQIGGLLQRIAANGEDVY